MIKRNVKQSVINALDRQAVVALIGPCQVGKTTLALEIVEEREALYLDLEDCNDREKLMDPAPFLQQYKDQLVVLDEIHRVPELFQSLRGIIDKGRRKGKGTGRFLVLESASIDLLRQSGESLAGRIEYIYMLPLEITEVVKDEGDLNRLWIRGGFPDSYLAQNDSDSLQWRKSFIRTYLERDIPQFEPRISAENLEQLWTLLAYRQGTLLNVSKLATALSLKSPMVSKYIDLLVDSLLVRKLQPYHTNIAKRLVKSPKLYMRDCGLLHVLLGIEDHNMLSGHAIVGASWENFVIENLLSIAQDRIQTSFYQTSAGDEIDLLLEVPGKFEIWAVEIKHSLSTKPTKGFYNACEHVQPHKCFVVYAGDDRFPVSENVEAIGILELAQEFLKRCLRSF